MHVGVGPGWRYRVIACVMRYWVMVLLPVCVMRYVRYALWLCGAWCVMRYGHTFGYKLSCKLHIYTSFVRAQFQPEDI